jgi:VIT1/CCC1 family predicted Fe2+/Mn2+ transporter
MQKTTLGALETSTAGLPYQSAHEELHYINRSGWLRAAVLGANDGIVSVSSLVVGVAAADPTPSTVLIAGFAGLAAGAMSPSARSPTSSRPTSPARSRR